MIASMTMPYLKTLSFTVKVISLKSVLKIMPISGVMSPDTIAVTMAVNAGR